MAAGDGGRAGAVEGSGSVSFLLQDRCLRRQLVPDLQAVGARMGHTPGPCSVRSGPGLDDLKGWKHVSLSVSVSVPLLHGAGLVSEAGGHEVVELRRAGPGATVSLLSLPVLQSSLSPNSQDE